MPPELLLSGQMSRAVDVYSWGVVVWEMYQGHRPYAGLSHSQVLHAVGMGRLLELPKDMPGPLRDLLAAAMARDPSKRWAAVYIWLGLGSRGGTLHGLVPVITRVH